VLQRLIDRLRQRRERRLQLLASIEAKWGTAMPEEVKEELARLRDLERECG